MYCGQAMRSRVITVPDAPGHVRGPYDLDGWRFSDVDGGHIIDLRVGSGYMIYALTVVDRSPGDWRLIQVDCAVAEVDIELLASGLTPACEGLTLPVPVPGPPVRILEGAPPGDYELKAASLVACARARTWEFRAVLAPPAGTLVLSQAGNWRLDDRATRFSVAFEIWATGDEPRWRPDEAATLASYS